MSLPDLSPTTWLLAAGIIFLAYLVRGIAGFGSALVAVPLLALILPLGQVVPTVIALDFTASIQQAAREHRLASWRDLAPIFPFSFMGLLVALYLHSTLPLEILVRTLGLFIIGFAFYSLKPRTPHPHGRGWAVPLGFMGGFIGTLFGTGGPFYVIFMRMRRLEKARFRASAASLFAIDGGTRLVGLSLIGLFDLQILIMVLLGLPLKLMGFYSGHLLHHRLDEKRFMQFVSVLLVLSGISLVLKTL